MLRLLSSPELAERWGHIKPEIDKALIHGCGDLTSYGLFLQCLGGVAQCWEADTGFVMTRFEHMEDKKRLAITTATSSDWFAEGPQALEFLEHFARSSGCTRVICYGRRGWIRLLKKYGYEEPYVTVMKEI